MEDPMHSLRGTVTRAAAVFSLISLASPASATAAIFDSLDDETSSAAFTSGIDPIISGTFNTGPSAVRVNVSLLLRDSFPEDGSPSDTYTVSLDGGVPLSDLSFDPVGGLNYVSGSPVDFQGPAIASVTLPVTGLPTAWTVETYDQFAGVELNPNSLYWIELDVRSRAEVDWGITADVSGRGVASNYSAWFFTDDGFFLNKGVDPFPFDNALQMEVSPASAPEPSTWAMSLLGFAGLGLIGRRSSPRNAAQAA
jgi:MYXO-CTERM domain-containing protein